MPTREATSTRTGIDAPGMQAADDASGVSVLMYEFGPVSGQVQE
jgi:hypothetical protein